MVKKLSKASEERLLTALEKISKVTEHDEDPNEAIAKVASELRVPHGHVQLLVNAYNTGRSAAQRNSSDDVWEKAADFPLADTAKILEFMYPAKVKSASEVYKDSTISHEYQQTPYWLNKKESLEKQARKIDWKLVDKKPEPYPSYSDPYTKASSDARRLKKDLEEARYKAAYAFDLATNLKDELRDYFKQADHKPFNEVKRNSVLLHGAPCEALFNQLAEEAPYLTKQASQKLAPATGEPYNLINQCMEAFEAYQALNNVYLDKQSSYDKKAEELLRPFAEGQDKKPLSPVSVLGEDPKAFSSSKQADENGNGKPSAASNFFSGLSHGWGSTKPSLASSLGWAHNLGQTLTKPVAEARTDAFKDFYKKRVEDKLKPGVPFKAQTAMDDHDADISGLQQTAMLSDLLANDDVIAHHNPHEVMQTYSDLQSVAPTALANKEIARTLLRRRLQTPGSELFDLDQLLKVEKTLRDLQGTQDGFDDRSQEGKK